MSDKIDEISASPRNFNDSETRDENEKTMNTEDCPSARSSSSNKVTHKTEMNDSSPQQTVHLNNFEDSRSRSELSTSNSFSQKLTSAHSGLDRSNSRNPITGLGLGGDGLKSRRNNCRRDGNPVTGEGYKPAGSDINTTNPSLNGANQVINKNRIPPGGFSSGLW